MPSPVEGSVRGVPSSVVIAQLTSLSPAIDCGDTRLAVIQTPAAWTTANLTFQTSIDGLTYTDFFDGGGNEYTITATASKSILIPWADLMNARFLKIRSGTTGTPVLQAAARTLMLGFAG